MKSASQTMPTTTPKRVREGAKDANGEPKPKRTRAPRTPSTFANDVRTLAGKYRAKLSRLDVPKAKLEKQLANIQQQYMEAETILRDVEEMLDRVPGLPEMEAQPVAATTTDAQPQQLQPDGQA